MLVIALHATHCRDDPSRVHTRQEQIRRNLPDDVADRPDRHGSDQLVLVHAKIFFHPRQELHAQPSPSLRGYKKSLTAELMFCWSKFLMK